MTGKKWIYKESFYISKTKHRVKQEDIASEKTLLVLIIAIIDGVHRGLWVVEESIDFAI